jgi:hypothetical protein
MVGIVREFQRRIKDRWPTMIYIGVLERHPGGHGWHLHVVTDRFIESGVWRSVWGKGIVDIRKIRDNSGGGARASARRAAGYVAKYIVKDSGDGERVKGEHRFFRPQGISETVVTGEGTYAALLAFLAPIVRRECEQKPWIWWSGSVPSEEWHGPPVLCVRW